MFKFFSTSINLPLGKYTLPTTYNKASENVALVTFNYNAENKDDDYGYVTRQYTLNTWSNDTGYDPGDALTVITDIHLVPEYVDYLEGVEFPSNPQYAYSDFAGWYTDPDNGE